MRYQKAKNVLPPELLKEIQKYIQGESIYIPKPPHNKDGWGMKSGARLKINQRNEEIRASYSMGKTMDELSDEYFLAHETIRKIIYTK
ncbi:CD3324 family protein [Cytobacillus sp. FSL R7-0696]|uniref:CD3324 family protein n=1 Tax=Cytobacillus TaxID=2675230 RepID=UPI0030FBB029